MSNYRCKKCGKFVAKDAIICKYCGAENPIKQETTQHHENKTKKAQKIEVSNEKVVICPFCNSTLSISNGVLSEKHLLCSICGSTITNPFYEEKPFKMSKKQIIGLAAALFFVLIIGLYGNETDSSTSLKQGQDCVFVTNVMGGINEEADNRYLKYAVQDDTYGILELQMEGVVYGALKGDPCVFIRNKSRGRVEVYLKNKRVNIIVNKESIKPV